MSKQKLTQTPRKPAKNAERSYLSQSDVPSYSLEQAMRVSTAIAEQYGARAVTPVQLALALDMSPSSGPFRSLCGAAIAYGLTDGGYNASEISLTPLGKRLVSPLEENDELRARREAAIKPRIIREFLTRYSGAAVPRENIAQNVLVDLGVPRERASKALELIMDTAHDVGFLTEIKGKSWVDLGGAQPNMKDSPDPTIGELESPQELSTAEPPPVPNDIARNAKSSELHRRVYITHGKNREFLDPIKRLLGFGEMVAIVSVETASVSKPVPDKVLDEMRKCGAAIIHVDGDETLVDKAANERVIINPNVLIEIGAAMALYGRRFILLVREGVQLPSNLQGLYEVRYQGETLDGDATIRLLEAINQIKNNPLPSRNEVLGAS